MTSHGPLPPAALAVSHHCLLPSAHISTTRTPPPLHSCHLFYCPAYSFHTSYHFLTYFPGFHTASPISALASSTFPRNSNSQVWILVIGLNNAAPEAYEVFAVGEKAIRWCCNREKAVRCSAVYWWF